MWIARHSQMWELVPVSPPIRTNAMVIGCSCAQEMQVPGKSQKWEGYRCHHAAPVALGVDGEGRNPAICGTWGLCCQTGGRALQNQFWN